MSGLSCFATRIQSWFLKTQSTSNHSSKYFSNVKSKSKWSPKYLKTAAHSQQKCLISFPSTQSKSGPAPKFRSDLQSGSKPNWTSFATVLIQSTPSPVQCSSLVCGSKFLTSHFLIERQMRQSWNWFYFAASVATCWSLVKVLSLAVSAW